MSTKYPRTPHLETSPGFTPDDEVGGHELAGKIVVAMIKYDGENTTMARDICHARSLDSAPHESRDWVRAYWNNFIRYGFLAIHPHIDRICGENLFARHSIAYDDLASYFYGFSAWTLDNVCLSHRETEQLFRAAEIYMPEVFYVGPFNPALIHEAFVPYAERHEGYVVRNADSFHYDDFSKNVAKWVRENHVQTDDHWMHKAVVPNGTIWRT